MSFTEEVHYSTNATPMIPWHLDSEHELGRKRQSHELTVKECLHQPWRTYWPPKTDAVYDLWFRSEHPEVLSWRFSPTQPFDRPWRVWTKTSAAQKEKGAMVAGRMLMDGDRSERSRMTCLPPSTYKCPRSLISPSPQIF